MREYRRSRVPLLNPNRSCQCVGSAAGGVKVKAKVKVELLSVSHWRQHCRSVSMLVKVKLKPRVRSG